MLSSIFLCLWAFLFTLTGSLSVSAPQFDHDQLARRNGDPSRDVYIIIDTRPGTEKVLPDGKTVFFAHSSLWVAGNSQDGPLKVEYDSNPRIAPPLELGLNLRIFDQGLGNSDKPISARGGRTTFHVGETTLRNTALYNHDTKSGLIIDKFNEDPKYRVGNKFSGDINDCNNLLRKLMDGLKLPVPTAVHDLFVSSDLWQSRPGYNVGQVEIKSVAYLTVDANGEMDTQKYRTPSACQKKVKRGSACSKGYALIKDGDPIKGDMTWQDELVVDPATVSSLPKDATNLDPKGDLASKPVAKGGSLAPVGGKSQTTLARAGGKMNVFTAVSKEALGALGIAGTLVGAAFVILDFVDHNWVGAAIGTVGLIAGLAAGFAASGPVGWIIGGAIAALFAILPGLFQDQHPPASIHDVAGIIQWKMFGDASHTGNEQCQKGTKDTPGNPDCQALYGAGTLSSVLGFNNFDAIVFLQQFNQGYPMSIKDMAAAFYVIDPTKKGDGGDKIATIDCHNKRGTPAGRAGVIGGDNFALCNHPEFLVNRKLINLPHLGTTADAIFGHIIPAPGGDCKLIAYPGTQNFPAYNIEMSGLPSAIACGLTAAINVDGVAVPIQGDTNGKPPQTGSSGSQSTDGQGGAFVAPPPPKPFASLDPKNYACISYKGASICMPPGTYQKQTGLGFEIKNVDTLTLPKDWKLDVHWENAPQYRSPRPQGFTDRTYTQNQSPPSDSKQFYEFAAMMKAIDMDRDGLATFTVGAPNGATGPDPICCLFTEPKLGGDVWCIGIGGGDLLKQWQGQPQSINCLNGAQAWIYAKEYGDAGAANIKGRVDDLKDEPYGADHGTFSKAVKAIWVSKVT